MQALGLVRIYKQTILVEISLKKIPECKKMGLGILTDAKSDVRACLG